MKKVTTETISERNSTNDESFMEAALAEAAQAKAHGEWPFGAVVVKDGKIISRNRCRETTEKTVLAHAELLAVDDACKALSTNNLGDCAIYCTNEPCPMCAAAIFQAKIKTVVIGASRSDFPHLLRERKLRIDHLAEDSNLNPKITRGLMKDRVMHLFADIKKS